MWHTGCLKHSNEENGGGGNVADDMKHNQIGTKERHSNVAKDKVAPSLSIEQSRERRFYTQQHFTNLVPHGFSCVN